ncbi:hypothetical protein GALL_148440 [mine drainage metagenome]|uniref:DUF2934 domain-containing protein n=1 Tax=mine drainage metagenome TaxID=410659 RepID=A0A1J5S4S3_9ZZZZ
MCARFAKTSPRAGERSVPAALQREQMIAVAAYFRAERRGFLGGDPNADWLEAEAEIDRVLRSEPDMESGASTKQFFQEKLEAQLKELDGNIEGFKLKTRALKAKTRTEYEKQIEALAAKRDELHERLLELRRRSEGAWEDLKDGAERALTEMREAVDRIADRFK